jgi:ABC-type multidrug transport system fused ATPase/permease subunit
LDEATSSVDGETDQILQRLIREEFRHCTVLTVAHRLDTIKYLNMVVVMKGGMVAEFGKPAELMAKEESAFRKFVGGLM